MFVRTLLGVHFSGDSREPDKRCIGEVVCPDCQKAMLRLHDGPDGVTFHAWVPGENLGAPGILTAGWEMAGVIDDPELPDVEGTALECWKRHGPWWVDAGDCRAMVAKYRTKGKRVRHPARPVPDELLRSDNLPPEAGQPATVER
jgi:hypothetical protein